MTDHPAWPWLVFILNTVLIATAVVSMLLLVAQQQHLIHEVGEIDRKLIQAVKVNQANVEVVAKKAGVPDHKLAHPELPVVPNGK